MDCVTCGFSIEEYAKREPGRAKHKSMSIATLSNVARTPLTEELDRIFREHHQLVYRTAYGVTGSREDAQDVLQTIFLRLLRREVPPDLKSNPKAYLYRAAVNLSLNMIRERSAAPRQNPRSILKAPRRFPIPNLQRTCTSGFMRQSRSLNPKRRTSWYCDTFTTTASPRLQSCLGNRRALSLFGCSAPALDSRNSSVLFRRKTHETTCNVRWKTSR
jgi:RNA polymerase sigma factor (sigma-70 family)